MESFIIVNNRPRRDILLFLQFSNVKIFCFEDFSLGAYHFCFRFCVEKIPVFCNLPAEGAEVCFGSCSDGFDDSFKEFFVIHQLPDNILEMDQYSILSDPDDGDKSFNAGIFVVPKVEYTLRVFSLYIAVGELSGKNED